MDTKNNHSNMLPPNAKAFSESMQKALAEHPEYDEEEISLRPVDYSFMDEPGEMPINIAKHNRRPWVRPAKIAAILVLFFAAVIATSIYITSEPAIATKFKLEKKFHEITNSLLSTDENIGQSAPDDNAITYHIDSMNDMDYAKKIMPGLCTPEYIPEEYKLDSLDITKYIDGTYTSVYSFSSKNNGFSISIQQQTPEMYEQGTTSINVEGEMLEMSDRSLYVWNDDIEETYGIIIIKDIFTVNITGTLSQDEMVLVAKNLRW